ncbi:Eco57I restriction-modification methylase domain-containing protein [Globicatella sanguinis]|uniref:Eco57I restriction-modification methylase domain-containing protein n=1 Tax=Globicatella sanguinis TaxID=13076 RepID=UPI0008269350|nr:Eco57I restriction-modification methylase domain-containing protein [Globicatella sanguinis]
MNRTQIKPFEELNLKIYGYTLPQVPDHDGYIKIGETSREVEARIQEQVGTAGLIPDIKFHRVAQRKDGQWFHDSDLHRYLTSRGVRRHNFGTSANEWFYFNGQIERAETLTDEFIQSGASKQQVTIEPMDYELRSEQAEAVEETLTYYRQVGNEREFLWNAKPRFGKTLTTYDLMLQLGAVNTLIVTNRPAIANSWYEDFHKFISHKEPNMKFVSETDALKGKGMTRDEFVEFAVSEEAEDAKQVTFISLQDLKGARFAGGPHKKLDWVAQISWDLLVIDEAHEGVDTRKTDRAFDKINRDFTLHLSGTPFKAIANEKFAVDQIYNWSYLDEQQAKANWDPTLDTNPYEKLPTLSLFTYQMSSLVQERLQKGANLEEDGNMDYAFDLNEFFATKDNGRFEYEASVVKFLDNLSQGKMPFSPTEYRHQLDHTFWLLPRVAAAKALEALLKKHPVFKDYQIILAAGDGESLIDSESELEQSQEIKKNQRSYDKVKAAIAKYPKTITLSVGQLTTGVTIPEWTAVLMLSNIKSPALYFQAAFRAQNPYEYEKDGQLFRKENAYIFDFAPERTLILFDEFANNLTPGQSETTKRRHDQIKTLLNFFPVIAEDNQGEMKELNAEEVLTIPRQIKAHEVVRQGFMSNLLFNNIVGIFGAPKELVGILNKIKPEENKKHAKETRPIDLQNPMLNDHGEVEIPEEIVINRTRDIFGDKVFQVEDKPESVTVTDLTNRFMDSIKDDFDELKDQFDLNTTQTNRVQDNVRRNIKDVVEQEVDYFTTQTTYIQKDYNEALVDPKNTKTMVELDEERQAKERELRQEFQQNIQRRTQETLEKTVETEYKKVEERKKNQTEQDTRVHLRGFTRTIPAFLMAYGDRDTRLNNFEQNIDPNTFLEITSITIEEFKKLRDGFKYIDDEGQEREFKGFFDETVFNASIREFFDKKDELADYFDEKLSEDIFDYIPDQQTNQIYTPRGVVKLMVDKLEEENPGIFENKNMKFADLYTKSGLYLTELVKRLNEGLAGQIPDQAERIKWILENQVYGVAPSNIIYNIAKNYVYGIHGDIDTRNLVQWNMAKSAQEGTMEEDLIKAYGGEKVKFDVIVGNPPYSEEDGGAQASSTPLYNSFIEESIKLNPDLMSYIIPTRWYVGGKGLDKFRSIMLNNKHISQLHDFLNPNEVFPNTNIRGGVCFFVWNQKYDAEKNKTRVVTYKHQRVINDVIRPLKLGDLNLFIRDNFAPGILEKLTSDLKFDDFSSYVSPRKPFGLPTNFNKSKAYKELPDDLVNPIVCYSKGFKKGYIEIENISTRNDWIKEWKILTSRANNVGTELPDDNVNTLIAEPNSVCTESYVVIGGGKNLDEIACEHIVKYIKTKFFRYLHGLAKASHDATSKTYQFIPIQNFTSNSDIDWSKSIPEIDQQLYAKYGLSEEEIQFIEENVQPME